jgi:hypothetical protein
VVGSRAGTNPSYPEKVGSTPTIRATSRHRNPKLEAGEAVRSPAMARQCARPGCNAPATATITFDGLRRIVWLNPLAEAAAYSAGDLCRRHAEHLRLPRNWELRDTRPQPGSVAPTGAPAPSRYVAPAPAPPPTLPFERPAARRAARPLLGTPGDDAAPVATSPLLSRAFRNAG